MKTLFWIALAMMFTSVSVAAQEGRVRLAVPQELEASGFMQFLVPRFSLKTSVGIDRVKDGADAEMRFGPDGDAVFTGLGSVWGLSHNGDARAVRFLDWLLSDIGQRTIETFETAQGDRFSAQVVVAPVVVARAYDGSATEGERLSLKKCGRCHVINETNRMKGMGATPSFAVLRSLADWDRRFESFHLLNPHPSFTQVENVSDDFDPTLPSPIVPVKITLDQLNDILTYVADIAPADLGAPLQVQ